MRLGKLEIGLIRKPDRSVSFYPFDWYLKGMCGCHMAEFFCFYATWLGNECYGATIVRKGRALKRLANIQHIKTNKEND